MRNNSFSLGIAIIVIGVLIILGKLGVFQFIAGALWPASFLIAGIVLHLLFFSRFLPPVVLIPGGMLITYALMFFYCNIFGWSHMSYLWPGFIFGIAVGLYECYMFAAHRHRSYLLAALILAVIAAIFFLFMVFATGGIYVFAIALIIAGGVLLLRRRT